MREYLLKNKWTIVKVVLLLIIFLTITAFIHGRNIYKQKVQQLEEAKKVFGDKA